jgi:hypothetical protein
MSAYRCESFEFSFSVPWKPSIVLGFVYLCKGIFFERLGFRSNVECLKSLKGKLQLSMIKCWENKMEY